MRERKESSAKRFIAIYLSTFLPFFLVLCICFLFFFFAFSRRNLRKRRSLSHSLCQNILNICFLSRLVRFVHNRLVLQFGSTE